MGAHVTLAVRNTSKGEEAKADILASVPDARLSVAKLDLASLSDVARFARAFMDGHDRLDILVNNAGLHTARRQVTEDGFELTFQTNHLGHFLLTRILEDLLRASAPARVLTVASEAHRAGRVHWDDLQFAGSWSGVAAYSQSKLANILFSNELARRLEGSGVTSNAVHPGSVRTRWARGEDSGLLRLVVAVASPFLISPEKGARTSVHVAASPDLAGVTGAYFVRRREARPARAGRSVADAVRLWDVSEGMVARFL